MRATVGVRISNVPIQGGFLCIYLGSHFGGEYNELDRRLCLADMEVIGSYVDRSLNMGESKNECDMRMIEKGESVSPSTQYDLLILRHGSYGANRPPHSSI